MITKDKSFVSAVLYIRNNEGLVREFLPEVYSVLDSHFERFEIICVNDASSDNSRAEIEKFSKQISHTSVSIINMSSFHGLELAMDAGIDLAIGDFVYEFDSLYRDYDLELVNDVYQMVLQGYDIVSATPKTTLGIGSRWFYRIFNRYSLSTNEIQQEPFRILTRRAINRVKSINNTLSYRKAVYANCGLRSAAIPYPNTRRKRKIPKEEQRNRGETAIEALVLFTNFVQKFSLYVSILFLLMTIAIGIYTWIIYFGIKRPVEGWTPLMLFLSLGFFGVFLLQTVILQYLSVILKIIFKKKQYLIESIEKLTNN